MHFHDFVAKITLCFSYLVCVISPAQSPVLQLWYQWCWVVSFRGNDVSVDVYNYNKTEQFSRDRVHNSLWALNGHLVCRVMTTSNGNIFRVTGHLCGAFTGHRWIPVQRPVKWTFDVSLICAWMSDWVKPSCGWWFETPSRPLWRHSNGNWAIRTHPRHTYY